MHFPGLSHPSSVSWVCHRGTDLVGPAFCALPRSEQLRWPDAWWAQSLPGGGCDLSPPPSLPLSFLCVQPACLLTCAVSLLGADLWLQPSWRMPTVQNPKKSWLATKPACSLVEDASLGLRLPASSSGCPRLPVSGGGWLVHSWLHLLSPLFCEWAWQCLRLGLFSG